jgi:hypothetical protein
MGQKIVVGPIDRGIRTDRLAFNIDNDSFPTLINAYQWRGRIKRKRGTGEFGRLNRFIGVTNGAGNATITINPHPISSGISQFVIGTDIFTDQGGASPVTMITNSSGTGVLNRTTGVLTITGSIPGTNIFYYPGLPVMGLEDLVLNTNQFPGNLAFDTTYSYNITPTIPPSIYDVSFYKNPVANADLYPGYIQKASFTTTTWNGEDYQQFWTVNYQGALWATNGIDVPFTGVNIGMQFAPASTITYVSNTATTLVVKITGSPLVVGDFVFVNEWQGVNASTLNFLTGYVTNIAAGNITITFPFAAIGAGPYTPGIIQYLTNRSNVNVDCIRWYDGDPTSGGGTTPDLTNNVGWVNFMPPLSRAQFSIGDTVPLQYYLVGCRQIVPFKDRLLFFGAVIQSSTGNPIYLQDTVVYSQNGTPYYTATFDADPTLASTVFNPMLTPQVLSTNNPDSIYSAVPGAYWSDQTGFGGFQSIGVDKPIITVAPNKDAIIVGLDNNLQTKLIYSGNDVLPFNFYLVNSELGSSSTFSQIIMDKGVISRGDKGIIITNQDDAQRIDLEIPDQVFEFNLNNNGTERVTAQRDFINEWIYLTYCVNQDIYKFPNQTLQYNYRDNSWAIFDECYTTYGQFKAQSGLTWNTVGYSSWNDWTEPWDSGSDTLFQPQIIAGNQQGYIVLRDVGTSETPSLSIQNIVGSVVTVPNHTLNEEDYILITGALGDDPAQVNGKIFQVGVIIDENNFNLNQSIAGFTYEGGGQTTRMYVPFIQTRQFPVSWEMARKTRIGVQQYLLSTTSNGQITLQIYLSQNDSFPYNVNSNSGLIYSTVLYTCPESTNLGLTPFNTNLQMLADPQTGVTPQQQIWHRINTSLLGDTVQIGFTMDDTQMRTLDDNGNFISQFEEIEIHGFIIDVTASMILA